MTRDAPASRDAGKSHRLLVLLPVLLAAGVALATATAAARSTSAAADADQVAKGKRLFVTGCSSCHGVNGEGLKAPDQSQRGPSLVGVGEASAYFQLHTGRMPLGSSNAIPVRKKTAYSDRDIDALVAYVGSLGDGPAIPKVDIRRGDLQTGGELFRTNCAACHSATGAGGALSYGRAAPGLGSATPLEVGSAMRSGPGQMPQFGPSNFSEKQVDSITRYVIYLRQPEDPGGISLGRLGPIPEGLLIWVVGMGGLLIACGFIAKHNTVRRRRTRSVLP